MPIAQVRGIDLYHEASGEGDVVVFVNGGFVDHINWLFVAPILADSFHVVTFDGRGHGLSGGAVNEDPFENVEDLAALIEFLGVGPIHVVGNSGGGLFAMQLASRRPELFRSLSVNEPPFIGLLADDPLGDEVRDVFEETGARLRGGEVESGVRGFCEFVGMDWDQLPSPLTAKLLNNAHNYAGEWFMDSTHPVWSPDVEGLHRFPRPIQLTTGSETVPSLGSISRRLADLLPSAELAVIEGAGHGPMFDKPVEYAAVLGRFLRDAGTATSL